MNLKYERAKIKQGYSYVIGCDEVGRGCLAGPVVAAAVILEARGQRQEFRFKEIKDSKLLTASKREQLSENIKENALAWSIAEVSSQDIDKINIHNASLLAMRKAVEKLSGNHSREWLPGLGSANSHELDHGVIPDATSATESDPESMLQSGSRLGGRDDTKKLYLFIDGKFVIPKFDVKQESIIGGDNKVLSIAAASVIAKVYRDQLMREFDKQYPNYNFSQHKGYATLKHRTMVKKYGLSPIHRVSFCKNISQI